MLALALAGGCGQKKNAGDETKSTGSGSAVASTGSGAGGAGSSAADVGSGSAAAKPEAPKADPKVLARGEYLVNILGCGSCHMGAGPQGPDPTKPFAGGLAIPEKFGTWRGPNITPHMGSGIGNWTEEQIVVAMREGVRPDGSKLLPMMPYLNYNRMTDDDAKSIAAYLKTVAPIDNVVAPNSDIKVPAIPAPKPANAPDVVDDPMKHGEYLVTLMHCVACHSPTTKEGAPDMSRPFAGGMEFELAFMGSGTLYGSNITSDADTGIGKWSPADVESAIKMLKRPDGSLIQGPMQFYLAGWSKIEDNDLKAIATFVKAIPAVKNKVPKSTFKPHGPPPGPPSGQGSAAAGSAAGSAAK
ncbi:MAG: cytochrome c [Kofleriaceae bacterium]|nr:cytochrome c [Kofleriaceae bacterium]